MTPDLATRAIDAVVIGTSAGGVDALSALLPALPAGFPLPVFVVLHLPRERTSLMVTIFQRKCALPIVQAGDKDEVAPGTVYFAPPDYHLLIDAGPQLALSADEPVHFSRPAIDVLFDSAADVYGTRLLGIILTGASQDGAMGLRAVHLAGGVTVAQRPDTAQAPLMVEAAIRTSPVDFILSLDEIADLLRTLRGPAALMAFPRDR